jgi:hypothetical protein
MIANLAPAALLSAPNDINPVPVPATEVAPREPDPPPPSAEPLPTRAERKQLKPRIPSKRNREIYRQHVLANRSQRDVAAEFDLTQPRVAAICKQVKRWLRSGQAELENLSEEQRYNLVTNESRMRLNLALSESYKWLQVTGQPSETRRVRPGKEGQSDTETTYRPPNPKSPFIAVMLRAAIELAKLDGAGQYGQRPAPAVASHSSSPPSELLSRGAPGDGTYGDDPDDRQDASDCDDTDYDAETRRWIARRKFLKGQKNCYRALASAAGLAGEQAELFEDAIVDLEIAAEEADAMAQQELAQTATALPDETPQARQARLEDGRLTHIVRLVDECDANFVDQAKMVAAARYDARTGRFDWRRGDPQELAVLIEEHDYGEGTWEESAESMPTYWPPPNPKPR